MTLPPLIAAPRIDIGSLHVLWTTNGVEPWQRHPLDRCPFARRFTADRSRIRDGLLRNPSWTKRC